MYIQVDTTCILTMADADDDKPAGDIFEDARGGLPGRFEDAGDIFEDLDPFLVTFEAEHGGEQLQISSI
jgi:hypothetical protein